MTSLQLKLQPILLHFFTLIFLSCTVSQLTSKKTTNRPIKVFLLAGQSNMEGRADCAALSNDDRQRLATVKDRVTLYYNHQAPIPLDCITASKSIQKKYNLDSFFGPELFLGMDIAEAYPNHDIIFIKRAMSGVSLYGAWNPNWDADKVKLMNELDKPKLFDDFIAYTKSVLSEYPSDSYQICGMFWLQGESDDEIKRFGLKAASSYDIHLKELISKVRKVFHVADLPFVFLEIGIGKVADRMHSTAKELSNVILVPNKRFEKSPYYYPKKKGHYDAEGIQRISHHFFEMYRNHFGTQ